MTNINIVVAAQVQDAVSGLNQVNQATKRVGDQVDKATKRLKSHTSQYNRTAVSTNKWAKGALQQAGYQVGDFAVQVANGTSSMQAFGQQGSQLLGVFGPIGAVLGAGVAIFSAIALAAEKSGASVGSMTSALGVLEQPLKTAVASLSELRDVFGSIGPVLVQNIDTAIIAVGLFAGAMGVKYVASVVAASVATVSFTSVTATAMGAVMALKAVLMRFLPVAILIGVAKLIEMFLQLTKGAEGFGNAMGLLSDLFSAAFSYMAGSTQGFKLQFDVIVAQVKKAWFTVLLAMQEKYMLFLDGIANATQNLPFLGDFTDFMNEAAGSAAATFLELESAVSGLGHSISNSQGQIDDLNQASLDKLKTAWGALKEAFGKGRTEIDGITFSLDKVSEDGSSALTEVQKRTMEIANSIQTNMTNAFMSMVDGTKSVKDAFKDMARSVIAKLYEVLVVQRIVNAAMGLFGFSQNSAGQYVNWSNPFGGGGKAIGGPVQAGQSYLVGERGPEMFVPSRSGSIIPNDKMSSGGGVTVVQNINVSTGVQQTVRTEIKSLMPQIAESAKAAVADAKRRGGSYGRAFA